MEKFFSRKSYYLRVILPLKRFVLLQSLWYPFTIIYDLILLLPFSFLILLTPSSHLSSHLPYDMPRYVKYSLFKAHCVLQPAYRVLGHRLLPWCLNTEVIQVNHSLGDMEQWCVQITYLVCEDSRGVISSVM